MNPTWEKLLKRDKKGQYPREEIDQILADPAVELRASWLEVLKDVAAKGKKAKASSRNQAAYACLFLAELKVTEALQDLLRLYELPDATTDEIFGDFFLETIPWVLYRCSEGQEAHLIALLNDPARRHFLSTSIHELLTARRKQDALSSQDYIRFTRGAIEAHAAAGNNHIVTELIWNWAEVTADFDATEAHSYFARKLTDSTAGTWDDLQELVLNPSEEYRKTRSEIDDLIRDSLHDRTRIWSIRSEEAGNRPDWNAQLEALDSTENTEKWLRSFLDLSKDTPVPEAITRFMQQYSKERRMRPEAALPAPLFISYSLGLLLAPGHGFFKTLLGHVTPLYQGLNPGELKHRVELIQNYWNALVSHQTTAFRTLCRSDMIQNASGMGWAQVLNYHIEHLHVFREGLGDGEFFARGCSSAEQERKLNWLFLELEEWEKISRKYQKSTQAPGEERHWDLPPSKKTLAVLRDIQNRLTLFESQWQQRWQETLNAFVANRLELTSPPPVAARPAPFSPFKTPGFAAAPTFPGGPLLDNVLPFRRDSAKVGRNDPCPCGSGKKHKQCCGNAAS
jgi:hypothetical protein